MTKIFKIAQDRLKNLNGVDFKMKIDTQYFQ